MLRSSTLDSMTKLVWSPLKSRMAVRSPIAKDFRYVNWQLSMLTRFKLDLFF